QQAVGLQTSIIYDEHGKPHLENSTTKISVSHTKEFVALLISETNDAGIDIEKIHHRIEKIAPKFLSEEEKTRTPSWHQLRYYHIIWGAKEVLFKIHGRGELLFKEHLFTEPFTIEEKGSFYAWIKKD